MKREIKFRGKRIDNGEWVYGYLWLNRRGQHFIDDANGKGYEVDPETVGQLTGLKDKNGLKEIYEGDIVSAYNGRIKGPVIFDSRGLAFGIPKGPNEIYQFSLNFLESKDIEVVGNIHEQTNES